MNEPIVPLKSAFLSTEWLESAGFVPIEQIHRLKFLLHAANCQLDAELHLQETLRGEIHALRAMVDALRQDNASLRARQEPPEAT